MIARKLHNVHRDFNVADGKYQIVARNRLEEKFRIVDPNATSADITAAIEEHGSVANLMQARILSGNVANEKVSNAARDAIEMYKDMKKLEEVRNPRHNGYTRDAHSYLT